MSLFGAFDKLRKLFGAEANSLSSVKVLEPVVQTQDAEGAKSYPPGFREFITHTVSERHGAEPDIAPNIVMVAVSQAANRGNMAFVNQALDLPEIQDFIEHHKNNNDFDVMKMLQPVLSRAVLREDKDTVQRLLDIGVNPQSRETHPICDALFASAAGQIPSSFAGEQGPWTSKLRTSETAQEIFKMIFENSRDRWGTDRAGFVQSLSGLKYIRNEQPALYGAATTFGAHAGILSGAREGILEALREIDPEIYAYRNVLPRLVSQLNDRVAGPMAPAA